MALTLPAPLVERLRKVHINAQRTPYYHIGDYMQRFWVLGDRCPRRNADNPQWHGSAGGLLYRLLTRFIAIRAHVTMRSDSDRHLHDHPWWSVSIVVSGGYWEVCRPTIRAYKKPDHYRTLLANISHYLPTPEICEHAESFGIFWRRPGAVVFRRASDAHRLILPFGLHAHSLFVMGRKTNAWGFYTERGKVGYREYFAQHREVPSC